MFTKEDIKKVLKDEFPEQLVTEDVVSSVAKKLKVPIFSKEFVEYMKRTDICRYCGCLHENCECE
jgi:hypothetical protein